MACCVAGVGTSRDGERPFIAWPRRRRASHRLSHATTRSLTART